MLLQTTILAQLLIRRDLHFALGLVTQARPFDFHLTVGQLDLTRLSSMPADLPAGLAGRARARDLLGAECEDGLQRLHLDFVNYVLHHLAGTFDQAHDGHQKLPIALTELLDYAGRFLGGSGHNLIWFLHGGWLLLRIWIRQPDSIETGATAVTNLQLRMGHRPKSTT